MFCTPRLAYYIMRLLISYFPRSWLNDQFLVLSEIKILWFWPRAKKVIFCFLLSFTVQFISLKEIDMSLWSQATSELTISPGWDPFQKARGITERKVMPLLWSFHLCLVQRHANGVKRLKRPWSYIQNKGEK